MPDPQDIAALFANVEARPKRRQGITGQTIEAMMRGTMCQITEYELDALRDEIARLQEAVNAEEMRANENKARAEKAEAEVEERHQLHLEQVRITHEWIERYDKAEATLSECQAAEEGAMMILTQTFIERDAARKALSESQALLAMAYEVAAMLPQDPNWIWRFEPRWSARDLSDAIRALTPADAKAALDARINAAKDEGRIAGLREAAEIAQSLHDRAATKGQVLNRNTVGKAILAKIKEAK